MQNSSFYLHLMPVIRKNPGKIQCTNLKKSSRVGFGPQNEKFPPYNTGDSSLSRGC